MRSLRGKWAVGAAGMGVILVVVAPLFAALSDSAPHPPPTSGPYAYNTFVPALTIGASYVDPVFGSTVVRVTTDHSHQDDIYAKNHWWNANETRYLHRTSSPDAWSVIDLTTNTITHSGIPNGANAGNYGFDPVNSDVLYYNSGSDLHKVTLQSGGTWSDVVWHTFPSTILDNGGTINFMDRTGRYLVIRYGSEPSVYVYDTQTWTRYANPARGDDTIDGGSYLGISPDGKYLVGYTGAGGRYGLGEGVSYAIDHVHHSVGARNIFWDLCGDHGMFISPSDGRDYMIVWDCADTNAVWRVDVTNTLTSGMTNAQERALPHNLKLLAMAAPGGMFTSNGHISTTATGDWAVVSQEEAQDLFNGGVSGWYAYEQEIIALNVVTGEVRRLAHHRSRQPGYPPPSLLNPSSYYSEPRPSMSWGGKYIAFASNFNQSGGGTPVVDIYAIPFLAPVPPTRFELDFREREGREMHDDDGDRDGHHEPDHEADGDHLERGDRHDRDR